MTTFRKFEEIEAWKRARLLTREIYALSGKEAFARDFGLRDQIRRASVSIMANIAEGYERSGQKEFIQFLSIAKGSAGEVASQLFVALDQGYVSETEFANLQKSTADVANLIGGLMEYLGRAGIRGTKYRSATTRNSKL
jgi:four helix bundle protein